MNDDLKAKIIELSEEQYSDGSKMYSRPKIALILGCPIAEVRSALGGRRAEYEQMKADPVKWAAYKERQRKIMARKRKAEKPLRAKAAGRRALAALSNVKSDHLTDAELAGLVKAIAAASHESMATAWFAGAKYLASRCKARKVVKS